jgi:hypothetical protein
MGSNFDSRYGSKHATALRYQAANVAQRYIANTAAFGMCSSGDYRLRFDVKECHSLSSEK